MEVAPCECECTLEEPKDSNATIEEIKDAFYGKCPWYNEDDDQDDGDNGDDSGGNYQVVCGCTEMYCGDNYDCFNSCGCNIEGDENGEKFGSLGCQCPAQEKPPCDCDCSIEAPNGEEPTEEMFEAFFGQCDWYNQDDQDDDGDNDDSSDIFCECTEQYCGDDYDCFNSCGCTIEGDENGEEFGIL